jgi:hypothetical protein
VLVIQRERRRHRHPERQLADLDVDPQPTERPVQPPVELRDVEAIVQREPIAPPVGRAHDQRVVHEVQADVERRAAVMQAARREPTHVDVERHVPPVVARRRRRQADLAHHLAIQMQRVLRRSPVDQAQLAQHHRVSNATSSK